MSINFSKLFHLSYFSLFYVSCRPSHQLLHYCYADEWHLAFGFYFSFFVIIRCDVETLQRSRRASIQTFIRYQVFGFHGYTDVVNIIDKVHFIFYRRFHKRYFYNMDMYTLELFLVYFLLESRLGSISVLRVSRDSVFDYSGWALDLKETRGWEEVRLFVFDLSKKDPWGEGSDFVRGVSGVKREGYFILLRARGELEFGSKALKLVAVKGDLGLWRVGVWEKWGRRWEGICEGRCTHPWIGDRFRRKQQGEVGFTLAPIYRGSWLDDDRRGSRDWGEWDEVVFALGWKELEAELEWVHRKFERAGLVFPREDLEDLVEMWDRMNYFQRMVFVDFIRLLGAWGEEVERAGAREAAEQGDVWGEGQRKFLFCLFVQLVSSERSTEAFICRTCKFERNAQVSAVVIDVLGFCFYRNLSESSAELWGEFLANEEGYRFMRRGGLGQFFRWGDQEWESRRGMVKRGAEFFSLLGERGWEMPWFFLEAAAVWGVEEDRRRK